MSVPPEKLSYVIHNIHTHIFTMEYIPKYFMSKLFPTTWARKKWVAKLGKALAGKTLHRYSAFFYSALKESQEEAYDELREYYPRSAKFGVLSVDFDYMGAGKAKYNFMQQLEDLAALKRKPEYKDNLLPFICVDPRRPNILELVKEYIEVHNFAGIKLYPALGFFPTDPRLYPVWEYAEKHQIPITTHCIPKNKSHFRTKITDDMIEKAKEIKTFDRKEARKQYDFAQYLNHPHWYRELLKDFPDLKLNIAHFGGNEEWDKYLDSPRLSKSLDPEYLADAADWYSQIRDLIENHKNVYSDISFTVYDDRLYPLLKNLVNSHSRRPNTYPIKEKVLFGTDFYMLQKDYRERRFGIELRGYLTDEEYWLIAERNPKRFLQTKF